MIIPDNSIWGSLSTSLQWTVGFDYSHANSLHFRGDPLAVGLCGSWGKWGTKEQTKCLSKLVKRLQVQNHLVATLDRWDWYEIHIRWGYLWDPTGGCFCVFTVSSTLKHRPSSQFASPPAGNGCDASGGSIVVRKFIADPWTGIIL